jgi:micrococcal nuclease
MKRIRGSFLGIIIILCIVVARLGKGIVPSPQQLHSATSLSGARDYRDIGVRSVVDGDTIVLETGERVRLIGIDTPEVHESEKLHRDARKQKKNPREIQEMGRKSWEYVKSLLSGQRVRLEFDAVKKDKYNRLLAYVYLKDGTFVNAEIVKAGYASLMNIPPNVKHAETFRALYRDAREHNRGLWNSVE